MTAVQIGIDQLVDIWLDGFASGVATTSKNLAGYSDQRADKFADFAASAITGDPAAFETVRNEVRARLKGADGGPGHNLIAYGVTDSGGKS